MSRKRRRGRANTSYSGKITKRMSESLEEITRESPDRATWRRLVRCAVYGRVIFIPDGTATEEEDKLPVFSIFLYSHTTFLQMYD